MPTSTWSHREANAPPLRLMMMITSASAMTYPSLLRRAGGNITPVAERGTDHPVGRVALTNGVKRAYRIFPMIALQRSARVVGALLLEAAMVVVLMAIGRRPGFVVPVGHLGPWLRDGDPATVVVALLRWVALVGAAWLLVSTLLYLAAATSRVPAAVRAVQWSTVPAVRRAIDAACAVSVVTSVALAPTPASATAAPRASDPASVSLVRDGRGSGLDGLGGPGRARIADLPSDTTLPPPTSTTRMVTPAVTPSP